MKRRLFAVAIFALATSCRSLPFPDPQLQGEYGKALKKWTRTVALYSGLETRAFVRVVYLSPDFIEAQAKEISRMRAEPPDQAAATLQRMREADKAPTFFAIAFMPDRSGNDWNMPKSVWRLALNMGEGEKPPASVERIEPPYDAEMRVLYPYLDDYSIAYVMHFPELQPGPFTPTEATLIAAGALGQMKFHWRLDGGPEQPSEGEPVEQKK